MLVIFSLDKWFNLVRNCVWLLSRSAVNVCRWLNASVLRCAVQGYRCQQCSFVFCVDCDLFVHETMHSCPGCASSRQTNSWLSLTQSTLQSKPASCSQSQRQAAFNRSGSVHLWWKLKSCQKLTFSQNNS